MKFLFTILLIVVTVFIILPKIVPHDIIESKIEEKIIENIVENIPLILKNDAPVSNLTVEGVVTYTNLARDTNGKLPAFGLDKDLNKIAEIRLKDMFAKQYFEHFSPQGVGAPEVSKSIGYEYILIGENIAMGNFPDDEALVKAWMDSPGHRANILNNRFTKIGIAVERGEFNGKSTWIAIQIFSRPASLCPSIDKNLQTKIDVYQTALVSIKADIEKNAETIKQNDTVKIKEYNDMVEKTNSTITELKSFIETYNNQVKAYNICIKN
ncbi:MAG: CAP domain-containing protein [Patescibacteria group bacterium]|nr:CAP domain-containing protein [Patescibacteria group bacterium]